MTPHSLRLRLLLLACLALPVPGLAAEARVAVAANFMAPMKALAARFEAATGHRLTLVSGSSGKLYAQIVQGAPFHLFLSADREKPRRLAAEGRRVPGTRFTYAEGRLVLWVPGETLPPQPARYLREGDYRKLAIAHPRLAPYGRAAMEVLAALDAADAATPRLVRGENIAQAWQFVASGNADAGLVALSQVVERHGDSGELWPVPAHLHSPILQDGVLLPAGAGNPAARALLDFLRSDEARALIRDFGYGTDDD